MFNHPFYTTIGCSLLLAFLRTIFIERSLLLFFAQFMSFPYWGVILIFVFFKVIRDTRETRTYRLLHTIYHENGPGVIRPYSQRTAQLDEFGLTRA